MSPSSDLLLLLKGLEAVGKAFLKQQQFIKPWQLKYLEETLSKAIKSGEKISREDVRKNVRITAEKLAIVGKSFCEVAKIMRANQSAARILPVSTYTFENITRHNSQSRPINSRTLSSDGSPPGGPRIFSADVTGRPVDDDDVKIVSADVTGRLDDDDDVKFVSADVTSRPVDAGDLKIVATEAIPNRAETNETIIIEEGKPNVVHRQHAPLISTVDLKQKLNEKSRESKVPASRVGRLVSYGGLVAGLGVGALAEMARRSFQPSAESSGGGSVAKSLILSEANAERIVTTLCKVRGGALKLGQMLSIQDNNMISPQLQRAFERVRQSADFMPWKQTEKVLVQELGSDWRTKFLEFDTKPFAAASIGQVHMAELPDNRKVAVKIQYPGVAKGIESDISNLATTLKVWKILPPGLFVENVMAVAKRELALEVDYVHEAKCGKKFKQLLEPYPEFNVPEVIDSLSTKEVLTTELIDGLPLDKCSELPQETRNKIVENILRLCLTELFEFRFMQTDPNWSNFFYDPATDKLHLLDFGSSREFPKTFVDKYMLVMKAATRKDTEAVLKYSQEMGFLTGYESKIMKDAHVDAVTILGEVFAFDGEFDFGRQNTSRRIHGVIPVMLEHRVTPPPEETYSLHRKLAGIFLLSTKLQARVNCKRIFDKIYSEYQFS